MTKKTPGPRAPPVRRRPSLKMTALSYSWREIKLVFTRHHGVTINKCRVSSWEILTILQFRVYCLAKLTFPTRGNVQLAVLQLDVRNCAGKYSETSINIFTWTTLTTNMSETGRERRIMKRESPVIRRAQRPGPSSQSRAGEGVRRETFNFSLLLT